MLRTRLFAEWALLFIAMIALMLLAHSRGWTERFDLQLLDLEAQLNASNVDPSIVLVEIDDRSLDAIGPWPWPRSVQAQLIDRLSAGEPDVVAFDVLFIEPSSQADDAELARALRGNGKVVLPHSFAPLMDSLAGEVPLFPLPELLASARSTGHVALEPDGDGVARRFELIRQIGEDPYPHFAVQTVRLAKGDGAPADTLNAEQAIVRFNPSGTASTISASEVISGSTPREFFTSKIVLIGATAPGLGDRYSVPSFAGGLLSGVEMQAQFVSALLNDDLIAPGPQWLTLAIQTIAIVILFLTFWRASPRTALIVALGLIAGLGTIALAALMAADVWITVGPGLLAIIVAYPLWGWRRLSSVSRFLQTEAAALSDVADGPKGASGEGFDVIAQQVARLKRLTGDVSRNLELVQDVINASPDAMLVVDAGGGVVMGNAAAEQLFGPMSAADGKTLEEISKQASATMDETHGEMRFANGRTFWLASARIEPEVGSQVLALREITDLKEAERQRQETLEFLSHDMRSPQVAIIGLSGKSGAALQEKERFSRIEEQARRTLKLTDDFVQIARIANEGVQREETELNSVIMEAADRAFALAHRKKISVKCDGTDDLLFALIDPSAIARMLDNLIGNAIKFSPEGSAIDLTVAAKDEKSFLLAVSDAGPGLPPERMERPFERFGASNSRAGPSAGLGLAYVKQVVDLHGGSISIKSDKGSGTRFAIELPFS